MIPPILFTREPRVVGSVPLSTGFKDLFRPPPKGTLGKKTPVINVSYGIYMEGYDFCRRVSLFFTVHRPSPVTGEGLK